MTHKKKKEVRPLAGEETYWGFNQVLQWTCCDCGLTHTVLLQPVDKKKIGITMWRNEYETAKERRGKK